MLPKRWLLGLTLIAAAELTSQYARAGDLKITIPGRSKLTPVQRLNREGVEAVRKHDYRKAEGLFYKAYLFDPDDAFTLNNLGYIAELQGQIERAQQFYSLAAEQSSDLGVSRFIHVVDQYVGSTYESHTIGSKRASSSQPC